MRRTLSGACISEQNQTQDLKTKHRQLALVVLLGRDQAKSCLSHRLDQAGHELRHLPRQPLHVPRHALVHILVVLGSKSSGEQTVQYCSRVQALAPAWVEEHGDTRFCVVELVTKPCRTHLHAGQLGGGVEGGARQVAAVRDGRQLPPPRHCQCIHCVPQQRR